MRDDKSDPLRAPQVDPTPRDTTTAGGFYLVGGVTVALLLVAPLLFFNPASGPGEWPDQARTPNQMPARP